jgi:endonuclease I
MLKKLLTLFLVAFICLANNYLNAQTTINSEDFSGTPVIGWTGVNVIGPNDVWGFTGGIALINGFNTGGTETDGGPDEDWLVSPSITLNSSVVTTLSFKYRERFTGPDLQLYYTTNYTNNPATTTWTLLTTLTEYNSTSTAGAFQNYSSNTILASLNGPIVLAFKYTTTGTAIVNNAEEWALDDILVQSQTPVVCNTPITQTTSLIATPSATSANISWAKGDGTNTLVLINTVDVFTDPVDGTAYAANAAYSGSGQQVIYNGANASVSVTGLTNNTTYYVVAYNFNNCGLPSAIDYVITTPPATDFATFTPSTGPTGEPAGYYNAANGLTCTAKQTALRGIISTGYIPGTKYIDNGYGGLWTTYTTSDILPGSTNKIWCIYTVTNGVSICGTNALTLADQDSGNGGAVPCDKYNREHTIPQSWFAQRTPMVSDAFHVLPTDKKINNVHGNQPYGETNGAVVASGNGTRYGFSSDAGVPSSIEVMEPTDEFKGDIARIYLYMSTRYGVEIGSANTAESNFVLDDTNYPTFKVPYLKMLLRWHNADPVSQKEIDRNNAVYARQNNRNPYVDHPEYVAQVWNNGCAGLSALPVTLRTFEGIYKNNMTFLDWRVEEEKDLSYYEVQRSLDGKTFTKIGMIKAAYQHNYRFEDPMNNPLSNRYYYRLKMMDLDGSYDYSKVISIEVTNRKYVFNLFPNPATKEVNLTFGENINTPVIISVTDMLGKVWLQQNFSNTTELNTLNINTLPMGNYIVQSSVNGSVSYQRLVVTQ